MSKLFTLFICLLTIQAQSDYELAKAAVMDYIEGTANSNKAQIKRAFDENAALYTVNNDGELRIRPIESYIAVFKEGRKNNRISQITYLEVVNTAATAIVEIVMGKRKFTDYILLLKIKGQWKIIQKSYTFEPTNYKGKILFVVSNMSTYGDNKRKTGSHFNEMIHVYDGLINNGYEIDFVSPKGGSIPLAYFNLGDEMQRKYFYDAKINFKLKHTYKPDEVETKKYKGVFYVGGSASMFDIPDNEEIMNLSRIMYEDQKGVIAAVCHGVVGLVNLKLSNGDYLVAGKRVNSFTNKEEEASGNGKYLPFLIETRLKERGALYYSSENWQSHVEVSERVVTGQNPASSKELVKKMIEVIEGSNL